MKIFEQFASIESRRELTKLGSGLYAVAYLLPDGRVLKVARTLDGTFDYLQWCAARLRKFGHTSIQMSGFPEVYAIQKTNVEVEYEKWEANADKPRVIRVWKMGYMAVMPRYESVEELGSDYNCWAKAAELARKMIVKAFNLEGKYSIDFHSGNVMFCKRRQQWLITDPLSDDSQDRGTDPKRKLYRQEASWKRQGLQALRHMHM